MADRIQFRRDTLAHWTEENPILLDGEMALIATDSTKPTVYDSKKVGDGIHHFNDLEMLAYECFQELGNSTLFPMSQDAVTKNISKTLKLTFTASYQYSTNSFFIKKGQIIVSLQGEKNISLNLYAVRGNDTKYITILPGQIIVAPYDITALRSRSDVTDENNSVELYIFTEGFSYIFDEINKILFNKVGLQNLSNEILSRSKNLLNLDKIVDNNYLNGSGVFVESQNYFVSDYISLTKEINCLVLSVNGTNLNLGGGCIILYDTSKNVIKGNTLNAWEGKAIWEEKVCFARFSVPKRTGTDSNFQIEVGTTPTEYVQFYNYINSNLIPKSQNNNVISVKKDGALNIKIDSLSENTIYSIDNFPKFIKKGLILTLHAEFENFVSLKIGRGINEYRGGYFELNNTNIIYKYYKNNPSDGLSEITLTHDLIISDYINIIIEQVNKDFKIILTTLNGYKELTFTNIQDIHGSGTPFLEVAQDSINLNVGLSCSDFKKPIWLIGDSYFGVNNQRVIGQLITMGYCNCYVNGLAGQGYQGAYSDLLLALNYGCPEIIVWCIGMNGIDSQYSTYVSKLQELSKQYGFEVIYEIIPSVNSRDKTLIQEYLANNPQLRTFDAYKAVGNTPSWYEGYQYSDNVHPTELGARAIAQQMLIEIPEIVNQGNSKYSVNNYEGGDK